MRFVLQEENHSYHLTIHGAPTCLSQASPGGLQQCIDTGDATTHSCLLHGAHTVALSTTTRHGTMRPVLVGGNELRKWKFFVECRVLLCFFHPRFNEDGSQAEDLKLEIGKGLGNKKTWRKDYLYRSRVECFSTTNMANYNTLPTSLEISTMLNFHGNSPCM